MPQKEPRLEYRETIGPLAERDILDLMQIAGKDLAIPSQTQRNGFVKNALSGSHYLIASVPLGNSQKMPVGFARLKETKAHLTVEETTTRKGFQATAVKQKLIARIFGMARARKKQVFAPNKRPAMHLEIERIRKRPKFNAATQPFSRTTKKRNFNKR